MSHIQPHIFTSLSLCSAVILSYFFCSFCHKSFTVVSFFALTISLMIFQRFSIGLRFGFWADHTIISMFSDSKNCFTLFTAWQGALSCIMVGSGIGNAIREGTTCCSISFVYSAIFTLPFKRMNGSPVPDNIYTNKLPLSNLIIFIH